MILILIRMVISIQQVILKTPLILTLVVSTYTITSLGLQDVFINELDPSGNFIWTKVLGGANSNVPYSIDVDATGNVHTAGYF